MKKGRTRRPLEYLSIGTVGLRYFELLHILQQLLSINAALPVTNFFDAHAEYFSVISAHPATTQCGSAVAHAYVALSGVSGIVIFTALGFEAFLVMASYCFTSH
ncbi:hypothetical protein [Morganella morganii]|uniref:hypothetical protein n=1 Tax=Morganella morganii TaxID=582 RepID=UPI0018660E42|nr:hypothetical protein [Morganella morganii]